MKPNPLLAHAITDRLNQAIGIDPNALDPGRLRWIIGSRCRHLQLPDASAYAHYLADTPTELDALIDEVVVQETRFFRDPAVFDHIRVTLANLAAQETGPIRILSAPCGTGQEAYSLAATLNLLGVSPSRYTIDAFDISQSALAVARRAIYPERALSHVSQELRQACGMEHARHWTIHPELRQRIHFHRRNLAEPGALGAAEQYHLILCRNLFIYLAPTARTTLANSLAQALAPGGRLFLGTADRVEELNALFAPVRPAASFAFVHRSAAAPARAANKAVAPRRIAASTPTRKRVASASALAPAATAPTTATELYQRAMEHRQRGELAKSERRCRQALYLAPNLLPALELLQTLWAENPNLRLRRALKDRILRNRVVASVAENPGWKETA